MLSQKFFPLPFQVELDNIRGTQYPQPVGIPRLITQEAIKAYISENTASKAPGPDLISNQALKTLKNCLANILERIFNRCLDLVYQPKYSWEATIIALRKPDRENYTIADNYCLIALLNMFKKILEAMIASKIIEAAKAHDLLLSTQMGAKKRNQQSQPYSW